MRSAADAAAQHGCIHQLDLTACFHQIDMTGSWSHLTVFFTVTHPDLALGSSNASITTPPVYQNKGGVGQAVVSVSAQTRHPSQYAQQRRDTRVYGCLMGYSRACMMSMLHALVECSEGNKKQGGGGCESIGE